MNERIKRLRQQSLESKPSLSHERAVLLTEFYESGAADRVSIPMARALAFKYLLQHKKIWLGKGELIVGERGPLPKATPTYPELCTHSQNACAVELGTTKTSPADADGKRDQSELACFSVDTL